MLRTQADVVEAFGGPRAFQARVCTARTAPYNYRSGTPWPDWVLLRVIQIAAEDGHKLSSALLDRIPGDTLLGIARYVEQYGVGK